MCLDRDIEEKRKRQVSVKDLTVINEVKFLGDCLDCHLSWNKQVNELVLKLKKDIFLMRKLVNYCDLAT